MAQGMYTMSENKVMKNTMLSFIKMSEKNKGKNQHILNLKVHKKISSIFPVNNFFTNQKTNIIEKRLSLPNEFVIFWKMTFQSLSAGREVFTHLPF